MIIRLALIVCFTFIAIYNLNYYVNLKIRASLELSHLIAFIIMLVLIGISFIYILERNLANYGLALVFVIYYLSSILARGLVNKGVVEKSFILSIAKLNKWADVQEMKFEYNKDDKIDVIFVTKRKAIRQSYDDKYEVNFIKIKKKLKI